jgi:fibronectin type III domain protein
MDVPDAPTNVVAVARPGGTFDLSWVAPTNTGSSALTGYTIDSTPGGLIATTASTSYTTTALTIGTSYVFHVRATNSFGTGPAGSSSSVVAGDVPSAPTNVVATAPSGRGVVTWSAANANGYPITAYTVVANPGGQTKQLGGTATTATFTGLTRGTMYTFTVNATNALGNGPGATTNSITANCTNNSYTLLAVDSCSVQYGTPPLSSPDGNIEATRDPRVFNSDLRGWAKFSLGTVPSWAVITSMTLTLNAGSVDIGTAPTPVLEIWYSSDDGWTRAAIPTPADIAATVVVSGQFGAGAVGFQNFTINVGARDWSGDVQDRFITLGIRNVNTNYSSNIYYGSDNNPAGTAPFLTLGTCE